MKTLKAICAAAVIASLLSVPAFADPPPPPGDIHVPGKPVPIPIPIQDGTVPPEPEPGEIGEGDLSLVTLTDMLWALAWIF